MHLRRTLVALLLLGAVRLAGAPLTLPTPPQQHAPWVAPENVPTNLASAVATLFEQGFPNPRGCEYREIEVVVSDVWARHEGPVKTRGWVLPATADSTQRFAICWNGVIYPVHSVGAPSDLLAEVSALPPIVARRLDFAVGEHVSVLPNHSLLTRIALLLRCGETDAALKLWNARASFETEHWGAGPVGSGAKDFGPYLWFAEDWAWALFDRLIAAHVRGDDALALATARALAEAQPKIEAEAARRGFPDRRSSESARGGKRPRYLTFLEPLPELLADQERRRAEGPRRSVLEPGVTNGLTPAERVRALVRDLDQVRARQWGQPGYVDFFRDPIVERVVAEGEAAVEPLLECLESDRRLTRSVTFPRDFMRRRTVLPVTEVARAILTLLWQYEFRHPAEARAYWNRFKGVPLEERWYAILQDDAAGLGRWREAAGNIVQTSQVRVVAGVVPAKATNGPPRFRGAGLRDKTHPSVSELLARRALEVSVDGERSGYDLAGACDIALCLAAWDAKAFVPVAQKLVKRCCGVMEYSGPQAGWPVQRLASYVGRLTLARVSAGDVSALEDYAVWLSTVTPAQLAEYLPEALGPLRLYATNAAMQALAERLFSPTNTFWSPLPWRVAGLFHPVESELVQLPAFRKLLARELDRKDVCGSIIRDGPASVRIQITNQLFGPPMVIGQPADRPLAGTNTTLRWCDWIAWSLSRTNQIPAFDPFAPVEERDRIIEQAKTRLQR